MVPYQKKRKRCKWLSLSIKSRSGGVSCQFSGRLGSGEILVCSLGCLVVVPVDYF